MIIGYPGGGASVGEIEGIHYYIYTKEANHKGCLHVHAKYAGAKASIGSSLLAGSLPHKKLREAQHAVRNNRGFLIHQWNEYNHGLAIPEEGYYYDPDQKKMRAVPYG